EIKRRFVPTTEIQKKLGRILYVSDAAHSFGATFQNKKIGFFADFTVFSFHAVKNLTTAEGGAICITLPPPFDNNLLYETLNILSLHGQNKDALAKTKKGGWEYDVEVAGFKCNMTDVLASIGLVELERYERETLPKRKWITTYYSTEFKKYPWAIIPPLKTSERETSYHLFLLRIKDISLNQRNKIIEKVFEQGVSVNVHYKPLPELTIYKEMGYNLNEYPVSKLLWESEISLPVYFDLTEVDMRKVVNAVVKAYNDTILL
ncbi:DegT/DnrJ/EryC1/StrS aminotransferase family protein, partial [Jiulongibacter sediminis]|uniref:DegT/DnrJ/EryC1/StrS family aminotransferase n=1 Tax=Jiulongibacter sediminis TaxID=1605367 RepID=UPI0026E9C79C